MTTPLPLHGLSRDVTLAVLPRLHMEELVTELTRRNISFGGYSIQQEFLVGVLKDAMIQEYHNLETKKCPLDDVANNRNFQFTSFAELAEREHFQHQVLQQSSQTLSMIRPNSDIGNTLETEATTQCHDEKDTCTSRESSSNDDGKCPEAYPDVTASLNSNMTCAGPTADVNRTKAESGSERTETGTSATTRPLLQLDNFSPPNEVEQQEAHSAAIQSNDSGFQMRNSTSCSLISRNSTCSKLSYSTFYSCEDCAYRTKHKPDFMKHTRIHTGDKPFKCRYCDYRATQRTHLKTHMLRHSGKKAYNCSNCDFKAAQKSQIVQHMRKHTGEKPYLCDECGYRAGHKTDIRRHMKTHTGDKPYICNVCGYRTTRNSYLITHQRRRHTGEKPYACGDCGYRSVEKVQLSRHMKQHTNCKPLSCDQCGFMTTSSVTLVTHKTGHSGSVEKRGDNLYDNQGKLLPIQASSQNVLSDVETQKYHPLGSGNSNDFAGDTTCVTNAELAEPQMFREACSQPWARTCAAPDKDRNLSTGALHQRQDNGDGTTNHRNHTTAVYNMCSSDICSDMIDSAVPSSAILEPDRLEKADVTKGMTTPTTAIVQSSADNVSFFMGIKQEEEEGWFLP